MKGGNMPTKQQANLPYVILNNPNALMLWKNATKEVRTAGVLISEFRISLARSDIDAYFDFADKWNAAFPKLAKKYYAHGTETVDAGAKMAGVSSSTIYYALRTTAIYDRQSFAALETKAQANGVTLFWTHLRTLAERLEDNAAVRAEAEEQLVQQQLTNKQLNTLIDSLLKEEPKEEYTAFQEFDAVLSAFKGFVGNIDRFSAIFEAVDNEFNGSAEQGNAVLGQAFELLGYFDDLKEFISEKESYIQEICTAIQKISVADTPEVAEAEELAIDFSELAMVH
jgi:hypothetical protein